MNPKPPIIDRSDDVSPSSSSDPTLEPLLFAVETALGELGEALRRRDLAAIELQSQALHRALERAVDGFSRVARAGGGVPPALRSRLMKAGGQVAAQRESLARATVALDRAMDVLMPGGASALYAGNSPKSLSAYRN